MTSQCSATSIGLPLPIRQLHTFRKFGCWHVAVSLMYVRVVVDLNEVTRSSGHVLSNQAAMHKHAVRPRGRRTLSAYQPYLVQHKETDQVCKHVWYSA